MIRSPQSVPNYMHNVLSDSRDPFVPPCFKYYAQCQCTVPENDDRVACSIFFRMTFSLLVTHCGNFRARTRSPSASSGQLPARARSRECVSPWAVTSNCRHGPSRAIAVMGRHERFRSELAAGLRRRRKSVNLDGDVLLSVWIEDKTSASSSMATATGSCIGRSRDARERPQPPARRKKPSPASLLRKRQDSPRVVPRHSS